MMMRRLMVLMVAVIGMFGSDAFAIYDAGAGRWLERDPVAEQHFDLIGKSVRSTFPRVATRNLSSVATPSFFLTGGVPPRPALNAYEYVDSTSLNFTDPLGLQPKNPNTPFDGAKNKFSACKSGCARLHGGYRGYTREEPYKNCVKGCGNQLLRDYTKLIGPYSPLSDTSPKCDDYACDDSYSGANARCFCKCAGNSPWSKDVRGCLRAMYEKGVSPGKAHSTCYKVASLRGHDRPELTLGFCFHQCRLVQMEIEGYDLQEVFKVRF